MKLLFEISKFYAFFAMRKIYNKFYDEDFKTVMSCIKRSL